jgi:DNA modification methylase
VTEVRLIHGSALHIPVEDESVQTCVTSPPYWGLRQYAGEQIVPEWGCALGLEPTPELYVEHMVAIFREVRRVLRRDGTLWLNLGDSYAANGTTGGGSPVDRRTYGVGGGSVRGRESEARRASDIGLKPKDLVGIPWMVAFALRADGWYLRSDIIWHKPNPMPESVTDRPTKSHEYLFLLSKSERYYYDADAIREPSQASPESAKRAEYGRYDAGDGSAKRTVRTGKPDYFHAEGNDEGGTHRNKRTVWTIATRPYPGAHFATYPEDLVEPCILAGSAAKACGECGAPWERVISGERYEPEVVAEGVRFVDASRGDKVRKLDGKSAEWRAAQASRTTTGWEPTCAHQDDSGASVVLDPFNGSGTTGRVAVRHGRSYIGVDISEEYLTEQATKRIDRVQHEMGI